MAHYKYNNNIIIFVIVVNLLHLERTYTYFYHKFKRNQIWQKEN